MVFFTGNFYTELLIVILALTALGVAYLKWTYTFWKRKGVEGPPPSIPLGNSNNTFLQKISLGEDLQNTYKEFKSKGLRYCGIYFLAKPIFVVLDVELIRLMMTKDFQHFTDHSNYVNEENDPLSGHLFSLKGIKWKNLRTKLTPTFTSGKMKMMFQTLLDCSSELIVIMNKAAKENTAIDIKDVLGRYTTDIIGSCAFGIECNSLQNPKSEFRKYGTKVFEVGPAQAFKNLLGLCLPEILDSFKLPMLQKDVTKFFMNVVDETVKYRESNNIKRKDFMHLLIQLRNNIKLQDEDTSENLNGKIVENGTTITTEAGKTLTMPEVAAQAFVFFLAGFETSSTTLTFCFYELATNPKIQDVLRDEINNVLEKHDGKITYDALMEMTYMDKCINETLRKYPPVPFLSRECTKTYNIPDSNVILEKGTALFLPILGIQRDPEYYPDPDKFDPERFSSENKAKRHAFTWLPFGEGPRACIGLRFGLMQTKVALTILLRNYNFKLNPKTKVPLVIDPKSFILSVKDRVWLTADKIDNKSN